MSFSGLTIKTFIVLKRRYALSLRLRSLFSMGARFVFQLCAVFLEGSTLIAVHIICDEFVTRAVVGEMT